MQRLQENNTRDRLRTTCIIPYKARIIYTPYTALSLLFYFLPWSFRLTPDIFHSESDSSILKKKKTSITDTRERKFITIQK